MKSNITFLTLLFVMTTSCIILPRQTEAQPSSVSFQVFYDNLSPYGQWIDYGNYGYVWIPDVASDFAPYSTDGHWIMTDYGWSWASDYNWGWAAFHYGRWSFTDSFGWFWVPDNEWGPAWVNWRQADGYYGWSPMEPGITVSMSFGNQYDSNYDHWMFVRDRDFDRSNLNQYYANRSDHNRIARNSVMINNTFVDNKRKTTYVTGPSRNSIQTATGRQIVSLPVQDNSRPGIETNNGRLQIYRPQIVKNNTERKPVPTRVVNQNDLKQKQARDASRQSANPGNMQQKPTNRVIQQDIKTQPTQQRNENTIQNQPNRVTPPVNQERINQPVQPVQQRDVAPKNNNVQPTQQRTSPVNQQRINQPVQPVQPTQQRDVAPRNNNVQPPVQQRNVEPVNTERNNQSAQPIQPTQQREVAPQNNVQPQQRNTNEQNNKPVQRVTPQATIENKNQSSKSRTVKPAKPIRQVKDDMSIKQQIRTEQDKIPDKVQQQK